MIYETGRMKQEVIRMLRKYADGDNVNENRLAKYLNVLKFRDERHHEFVDNSIRFYMSSFNKKWSSDSY